MKIYILHISIFKQNEVLKTSKDTYPYHFIYLFHSFFLFLILYARFLIALPVRPPSGRESDRLYSIVDNYSILAQIFEIFILFTRNYMKKLHRIKSYHEVKQIHVLLFLIPFCVEVFVVWCLIYFLIPLVLYYRLRANIYHPSIFLNFQMIYHWLYRRLE